jgi:CubicO group peptidase (beta-lactamase class C family)
MREVLGERLGHGRADAGPAARARPRPGRADLALLAVAALILAVGLSVAVALVLLAGRPPAVPPSPTGRRLRAVALRDTRIAGPAGRRFHYNNVNPVLLGMVLERATGRTVSAYLSERLWGPLGMEADGSWSLDSRRSRPASTAGPSTSPSSAPSTCTGASGGDASSSRAAGSPTRPGPTPGPTPRPGSSTTGGPTGTGPGNDFWAQGNHGQFVYVAPSRDVVLVRFGTGYHDDHWPDLLATLARRL